MLKQFSLQEEWNLIRVLRCTRNHAVLLLKNKNTSEPEVVKIISKHTFDNTLYEELSKFSDKNLMAITRVQTFHSWKLVFSPYLTPLTAYVQREGLSLPDIIRLTKQISDAICAMHDKGLLHLDISPDNIFLNDEGDFFLGDFCLSRHRKYAAPIIAGTPDYTAPECSDKHITAAADQYSFAVLLFALLHNGCVPKTGQKKTSPLFSEKTAIVSEFSPAYPDALYRCLEKALSSSPASRYESVSSFASDICSCLLPICKESSYQLHIMDYNDAFLHVRTQPILTHKKASPKLPKRAAITFIPILLCIVLAWRFRSHRKPEATFASPIPVASGKLLANTASPISSGNVTSPSAVPTASHPIDWETADKSMSHILDISNRNADTMTELFDEKLLTENWNILYGENNHFSSVDELLAFPNIREVYLSGNQIHSLDAIASLEHLEIAILSDNQCRDVQPLCSLANLSVLDLSGNQNLSQVACLKALPSLRLLILTDTSVSESTITSLQSVLTDCEIIY